MLNGQDDMLWNNGCRNNEPMQLTGRCCGRGSITIFKEKKKMYFKQEEYVAKLRVTLRCNLM